MKKLFLFIFCISVFGSITSNAQERNRKQRMEQFKTMKVAYLTEELSLSSEEAEKFWPIYNKHEDKIHELKREEHDKLRKAFKEDDSIDSLSDKEADAILAEFMQINIKMHEEQQKLYKELKSVLSSKKLLKLQKAENEFNRKILRQLQKDRQEGKKKQ